MVSALSDCSRNVVHLENKLKAANARIETLEKDNAFIRDQAEELSKHNVWLMEQERRWCANNPDSIIGAANARIAALEAENERQATALARIGQWCEAYPLDVFPEPDWGLVRFLLAAGGVSLDAVSASAMRRVVDGIRKLIEEVKSS